MIKVVVVEDEQLIRKGITLTTPWECFGCEVIGEGANGLQGKEMIERLKPDLVITDVRMPKMDGIQMLKELKDKVEVEYIIISGYDDFQYAQQAIRLGVRDYLLKPVEDKEFFDTLQRVVEYIQYKKQQRKLKKNIHHLQQREIKFFKEYLYQPESSSKDRYVMESINYIKEFYREDISVKTAAEHLYISESYLSRLLKKKTGYTFGEYLTNYRIKEALKLLTHQELKVYEVAHAVGYSDGRYFSSIFKKNVGLTPTEFKEGIYDKNMEEDNGNDRYHNI
ncbi:response regulator [Irregularibacter muris]|uniref:Stage 0 sporulation protein A homolog n=1 Tax=Irregularibacter muris TaxID=1796619 RepID=A0AAE3KZH9_9FIRM|nr:response regulator [Irregularibacter muris]MCR1898322.1 response regulator [Irregularibacter muris]